VYLPLVPPGALEGTLGFLVLVAGVLSVLGLAGEVLLGDSGFLG
jgi:hypothetical protein